MTATAAKLRIVMGRLEQSWLVAVKQGLVVDGRECGWQHDDYLWVFVGTRGWLWVIA